MNEGMEVVRTLSKGAHYNSFDVPQPSKLGFHRANGALRSATVLAICTPSLGDVLSFQLLCSLVRCSNSILSLALILTASYIFFYVVVQLITLKWPFC